MYSFKLLRLRTLILFLIFLCTWIILQQVYIIKRECPAGTAGLFPGVRSSSWNRVDPLSQGGGTNSLDSIQNSTLGFERLFVLSVPDRYDKKDVWSLATKASNLEIRWVDGIKGGDISDRALPAGFRKDTDPGTVGSFRGHLNAIRRIIDENLRTALIFEDDVDWDVMLRQQLYQFALGSRYIQETEISPVPISPYGDDWDVLLLGHCGALSHPERDGRYWIAHEDPTVTPASKHQWVTPTDRRSPDTSPLELQGNFTRLIYEAGKSRCSFAYAMSLRGAQRFLYQFSIEPQAKQFDYALSEFCAKPYFPIRCITAFPTLIDEYKAAGSTVKDSDRVDNEGKRFRKRGMSHNVVFPVKAGLRNFIEERDVFPSQWPQDSLWPSISPKADAIPQGHGVFLTKDKFKGYPVG